MTLIIQKSTSQILRGMSLKWDLSHGFQIIRLSFGFGGEKQQRKNAIFISSYQGAILITSYVTLDHLAEIVFSLL